MPNVNGSFGYFVDEETGKYCRIGFFYNGRFLGVCQKNTIPLQGLKHLDFLR